MPSTFTRTIAEGLLCGMVVLASSEASGEEPRLVINREKVARASGRVIEHRSMLFPFRDAGTGVVFRQLVRPPSNEMFVRVAVRLRSPVTSERWFIEVRDLQEKLLTVIRNPRPATVEWAEDPAPRTTPDVLWSEDFPPQAALWLIVIAEAPGAAPSMEMASLTVVTPPWRAAALPDDNDQLEEFKTFPDPVKTWGTSVARIVFDGVDGLLYHCTGFLLTADLLMTNYHCVQFSEEMENADVEFDADDVASPVLKRKLNSLAKRDEPRDMAIFRLSAPVEGRTPLKLSIASVTDGQDLVIIQHPDGGFKKVSKTACFVKGLQLDGWRAASGKSDFGHHCDTYDGSSGSPVQDKISGAVLGLHHLGTLGNVTVNRAVYSEEILKCLAAEATAIYDLVKP